MPTARRRRPSATRNSSRTFEGTANLTECTERLKQATRNYAKRQLTWFRRQNDAVWLYLDEEDVTERACTLVRAFLHNEE